MGNIMSAVLCDSHTGCCFKAASCEYRAAKICNR